MSEMVRLSPAMLPPAAASLSKADGCPETEFERSLIIARTGEGRARAKAKGVHMDRPASLTAHQRKEALARIDAGEAHRDIA